MSKVVCAALVFAGVLVCLSPVAAQEAGKKPAKTATITLRGSGDGPLEVLDLQGNVLEVYLPSEVRLNVPSEAVVAREKAYRENQRARAQEFYARKEEDRRAKAARDADAAQLAKEQRQADEKAAAAAAADADQPLNPYRVRRRIIRRRLEGAGPVDHLMLFHREVPPVSSRGSGFASPSGELRIPSRFDLVSFPEGWLIGQNFFR